MALRPREPVDDSTFLEDAADAGQAIGAAVALITLLFIAGTLRATREEARTARTTQLFDRYNNREFMRVWSHVLRFLLVDDEAKCVDHIRRLEAVPTGNDPMLRDDLALPPTSADEATRRAAARLARREGDEPASLNDVKAFVTFFEETAMLFNERTIERPLLVRAFGPALVLAFSQCWWFMHYEREGSIAAIRAKASRDHETENYADWERAAGAIAKQRPELLGDPGWTAPVRALCLPYAYGHEASYTEWRQCQALSRAVGDVLRSEGGFDRLIALLQGPAAEPGPRPGRFEVPRRTLCLPAWGSVLPMPSRRRRLVGSFGAWLDSCPQRRGTGLLRDIGLKMTRADPRICAAEDYQRLACLLDRRRKLADSDGGVDQLISEIRNAAKVRGGSTARK